MTIWQSAKKSQRSAIWCGFFCSLFIIVWPFVLQFSSFPFAFFLCPLWWEPSLDEVVGGDLEACLFLQCSSFGEVDFIDLETRF